MHDTELMGRVTASLMHDLQNVLSTIREASGLMDDLVASSKGAEHRDKLRSMAGMIQQQVERGRRIADSLNCFGHLTEDFGCADVSSLARLSVKLSTRFSRNRKVEFQVVSAPQPLQAAVRPIRLALDLLAAVECCLGSLPVGAKVDINVAKNGGEASVTFSREDGTSLDGVAAKLRELVPPPARVEEDGTSVRLLFPCAV